MIKLLQYPPRVGNDLSAPKRCGWAGASHNDGAALALTRIAHSTNNDRVNHVMRDLARGRSSTKRRVRHTVHAMRAARKKMYMIGPAGVGFSSLTGAGVAP